MALAALAASALTLALASPAGAATKTYRSCVSGAAPIVDRGSSALNLKVPYPKDAKKPQLGRVVSIRFGTRISHTRDSDLTLAAVSPAGFAYSLSVRNGAGGQGYGTGAADCTGSLVLFDDNALTSISTPGNTPPAPIAGSFKPQFQLGTFNNSPVFGLWTLLVTDSQTGEAGTVHAFSIDVTYSYKKLKKKKGKK
jgi:hypothetical protein